MMVDPEHEEFQIRELVTELAQARRDLAERSTIYPLGLLSDKTGEVIATAVPNPGATDAEIAAAERVLGRNYPGGLRTLLTVTNGFPDAAGSLDILGTQGVSTPGIPGYPETYPASAWGLARESLEIMFDEVDNKFTQALTIDDCIPVTASPITGDFHFAITRDVGDSKAGTIFAVDSGDETEVGGVTELLHGFIEILRGTSDAPPP